MFTHLLSQGGRLLSAVPAGALAPVAVLLPVISYVLLCRDIDLHFCVRKAQTS